MKNILYLSYDGLTDPLGQSQIIPYIIGLNKLNKYKFSVISFEKREALEHNFFLVSKSLKEEDIDWIYFEYTKYPPVLSTIYDLKKLKKTISKINNHNKIEIIHARGYITSLVALYFKKTFKIPFIFDMRGWWADEKLESGKWSAKSFKLIYKYFKIKEKQLFKDSDKIISLTNVGKKVIIDNNWSAAEKIGVIPTCVDFEKFPIFSQQKRIETRNKLNINLDDKVLVYSGSLGGNYDFKEFFLFFNFFIKLKKTNRILIVSKTPRNLIIKKLVDFNIDTSRIIIKESDFNQVHKFLQASDIGLILYKRDFSTIGRSPTKLGEYWASGIPAISLKGIGDLDFISLKYPFGLELLKSITYLSIKESSKKLLSRKNTKKLRTAAKEYYNIDNGVNFYNNIYQELLIKK